MKTRIPPPVLACFATLVMWALDRWLPLGMWLDSPWNWLGVLPIAAGLALDMASILLFQRAGTTVSPMNPGKTSMLVVDGVFRFSRNPMYLGLVLQLLGCALWFGTASSFLIPPLFVMILTAWQIQPEESALREKFGDAYLRYQSQTPRWLGRL